jgi:hypothetical protein
MEGQKNDKNNKEQILQLKINLFQDFFKKKKEYFQNLESEVNKKDHVTKSFLRLLKIPYYSNESKSFITELQNKGILNEFYKKVSSSIEGQEKINILQNGIILFKVLIEDKKKDNLFVYCIKDEKTEDGFLCDINHIETIDHSTYDNLPQVPGDASAMQKPNSDNGKQNPTKSTDLNTNIEINDIDSFSDLSEKKYTKDKISGLQNRALTLESLVNYYFKKFDLISLPDLIFNISDPKERIFLFREWDGAFMNRSQNEISYEDLKFLLPFNDEKKLLIKDSLIKINKKLIIHQNSIIFIEVKMEFPKKKEIIKKKKI